MDRKARIFLVCSVPFIRRGLASFFETHPEFVLSGLASNVGDAFLAFPSPSPDLLIIDPANSDNPDFADLALARHTWPALPILVFTPLEESKYALTCFRAGVKGFLRSGPNIEELANAIRTILNGGRYASPRLLDILLDNALRADSHAISSPGAPALTEREQHVLKAIGQGLSTRQIAAQLHLSIKTVETHRQNLKSKLRLRSSRELIEFARQS